ncbi:MAG TPA: DedA family protein [Pyrinomonadaceae bacterium]|nr:DedA family protein [Pyrinomonadaceae bacterium]
MYLDFLNELIGQYGLYAIFILVILEGDITLLIGGVLAHSGFFGPNSFPKLLIWATLGGCASDNLAYFAGRAFCEGVREFRFYRAARPRLERLTNKFGGLSIFLSKYIYGLRWAACVFYGVGRMPYLRFLMLSFFSCFLWVFILAGAGYFFSGAVMGLIGDFQRLGKVLLVIVVLGIVGFYLIERFWLSPKVEKADPERLQELEHAAAEKLHDLREEIQEHIPFTHRAEEKKRLQKREGDGD